MRNSLQTLGRIKKFELDELQRRLAAELTQEENLENKLKKLITDYEMEKAFAQQNPGIGDFGAYTDLYLKRRRALEKQLEAVRSRIEKLRDEMAEIFKERKTYEIVDDNRRRRRRKEIDAREQKMLDEIGTNAYIKKHQET